MLPYTPLHLLLTDRLRRPLVMTSGNVSEIPICTDNADAGARLASVADSFLMHDRDIVSRYDDSVVRVVGGAPVLLRRARGHAPMPVPLPIGAAEPLLAVGPHLKNTFTLAEGSTAFVSQHIGDLENVETLDHFQAVLRRYQQLFRIAPAVVARDMHPGYLSTRVAEELDLQRVIAVQHHHAHVAAVAAEHGITGPVVGVSYDGTGYGDDGHTWGAEILLADLASYRRVARLRYAPMPGGDLAARQPWRVAAGYLSLDPGAAHAFEHAFEGVPARLRRLAESQIERDVNAPLASSMGRLFDAAAAVLGVRREAFYEGQAAMELEALASRGLTGFSERSDRDPADLALRREVLDRLPGLPLPVSRETAPGGELDVMDPLPLLAELGERRVAGEAVERLAAAFHVAVARGAVAAASRACREAGIRQVALGGGVFQNALLLAIVGRGLEEHGFDVLRPLLLGPNDGSISYGQAAVAAALLSDERGR
jgi:hydrogenase maturation protein HypF